MSNDKLSTYVYMLLNDGRTFSSLDGCKVVEVTTDEPDNVDVIADAIKNGKVKVREDFSGMEYDY